MNELSNSQRNTESGIHRLHFVIRETADVISQHGFWEAYKCIAIDRAIVFKPFINANLDLSGNTFILGINLSTDYRRKCGVNELLPGNDQKDTVRLCIVFRPPINSIEIATSHKSKHSLETRLMSAGLNGTTAPLMTARSCNVSRSKSSSKASRSWYESTSRASRLSHSALRLIYSISSVFVILERTVFSRAFCCKNTTKSSTSPKYSGWSTSISFNNSTRWVMDNLLSYKGNIVNSIPKGGNI